MTVGREVGPTSDTGDTNVRRLLNAKPPLSLSTRGVTMR
jgi:hypothetical protein